MNKEGLSEKDIASLNWKSLEEHDIDSLVMIADKIHINVPERAEVFAEKIKLFPVGCRGLFFDNKLAGYGISHLWELENIPPLNEYLGQLPEKPTCIYIHDIVVLPEMRGYKAADRYIDYIKQQAKRMSINSLALVSLYGTDTFWNRFGFKIYSNEKIKSKLGSYGKAAKYMICDLKE